MEERVFRTSDVYLASALATLTNLRPTLELNRDGRVLFCFPGSEDLFDGLDSYNAGTAAPLTEYAATLKRLRGEMLSVKYTNGGRR